MNEMHCIQVHVEYVQKTYVLYKHLVSINSNKNGDPEELATTCPHNIRLSDNISGKLELIISYEPRVWETLRNFEPYQTYYLHLIAVERLPLEAIEPYIPLLRMLWSFSNS